MRRLFATGCAAVAAVMCLSGCLSLGFGGGRSSRTVNRSETENYSVTLGQQLIDLQKAYDAGIITQSQYNAQKKKLLRHYD